MLDKGIIERIVLDYKDIYKQVNVLLPLVNFVKLFETKVGSFIRTLQNWKEDVLCPFVLTYNCELRFLS